MSISGLAFFAAIYFLAVASPGPGVAALVARVLSRGTGGLAGFIAGFAIGDLIWFACAALGLSLVAQQFHTAFLVIKYAGAAYLLYLAFSLWFAPVETASDDPPQAADSDARMFAAGLALTLGNPKVMVFFLAILPTVVDLPLLTLIDAVEISILIAVIISGTLAAYAFAANRARRLIESPRARRLVNRVSGAAIAGAAMAVAAR